MAPHPTLANGSSSKEPPVRPVRILVTGFGPFQDLFPVNPSFEICKTLPYLLPATAANKVPVQILSYYSPIRVAYRDVQDLVPPLLASHIGAIDLVLHIGMASGRQYYTMEKYGHRDGYDRHPDLDNQVVPSEKSARRFADVDELMTTSLDYDDVWRRWQSNILGQPEALSGVEVRPSEDAGHYLCDYTYFNSLAWFARRNGSVQGGKVEDRPVMFLHVPAESDDWTLGRGRLVAMALIRAMVDSFTKEGRMVEMVEQSVQGELLSGSRGSTVA